MAKNGRKLKAAFLRKEGTQDYLSNLERLKEGGSVAEEQYESLKSEYRQRLTTIDSEIVGIKNEFTRELEDSRRDLKLYRAELEKLGIKYKVGEVRLEKYRSSDQKLRRKMEKIESKISELESLISVSSSADIGVPAARLGFTLPELSSFGEFVSSPQELLTPWTRLLGPVGGLLLFISIFLTWVSAYGFISFSGIQAHALIGAAVIICGLVGIGAAFLTQARTRGLLHIVIGALALIFFLIVFLPDLISDSQEAAAWGVPLIIGAGVYIYLLASIAVIVGGVFDLRAK